MNEDQARRIRALELAIEIARCGQPAETISDALKQIMEAARQLESYVIGRTPQESK